MPTVSILTPIKGQNAENLVTLCPKNVFSLKPKKKKQPAEAIVTDQESCSMCRACVSAPEIEGQVFLGKEQGNYLLTIESIGALKPIDIFLRSIELIQRKCEFYRNCFANISE